MPGPGTARTARCRSPGRWRCTPPARRAAGPGRPRAGGPDVSVLAGRRDRGAGGHGRGGGARGLPAGARRGGHRRRQRGLFRVDWIATRFRPGRGAVGGRCSATPAAARRAPALTGTPTLAALGRRRTRATGAGRRRGLSRPRRDAGRPPAARPRRPGPAGWPRTGWPDHDLAAGGRHPAGGRDRHDRRPTSPARPVWGLLRSAQTEHPAGSSLVDLDDDEPSSDALARAVATGEPQVALRGAATARARGWPAPRRGSLAAAGAAALAAGLSRSAGTLEDLALVSTPRTRARRCEPGRCASRCAPPG